MIEKGADPEKLSGSSLKLGMVCIGVALGLLVGPVLETHLGMPEPVAYFATVFLFGGIALVMHHIITGGKP